MKKKILSFVLALCLIVPCAFALVACEKNNNDNNTNVTTDDETAKVMNVSLNPKIEFVLDKNDKVLSVNALNEDGNHIISASIDATSEVSKFEGMTADEAVELFLEISEDSGYIITGDEDEIRIEMSGNAENLMKKIKEKANKFFEENNLVIEIKTGKIEKSDILESVKECMKEYTDAELEKMTQEQLVELLKNSREETKNLLTQELKDAYYNMRFEKINTAELEALLEIIEQVNAMPGMDTILESIEIPNIDDPSALFAQFEEKMETLTTQIKALEAEYNSLLEGEYNEAKQAYIDAKEALLAKRLELGEDGLSDTEKTELESFESAVKNAREAMEDAKENVDQAISVAKQALKTTFENVKMSVESIKAILKAIPLVDLDTLNNARENMKEAFKNHFKDNDHFGDHIGYDKDHWGQPSPAV